VSYLLDTNLVSEVMKFTPEQAVMDWFEANDELCFLSVVTIGEIERGIALLPSGKKKSQLQTVFQRILPGLEERVLSFDLPVARRWVDLTVSAQRKGRRLPVLDSMIEATALYWDLTIVTRNTSDFREARTHNPWRLG